MVFSLWQDNKTVSVLSTGSQPGEATVERRQKDATKHSYPCPNNIVEYNKFMGGVDRNDQMRTYYCVRLKGRKFYKYIFWYLFDVSITNTYILSKYVPSYTKSSQYADFRVELAKKLIGDYNSRKVRGRPQAVCCYQPIHFNHFPMKGPKRSKCAYCYEKKKELKWTQWRCETCSKYLCHTGKQDSDCFIKYHKK